MGQIVEQAEQQQAVLMPEIRERQRMLNVDVTLDDLTSEAWS